MASASSTTPSVTSGKSWPLATICVPTSTPEPAASKRSSIGPTPSPATVSASSRKTGSGAIRRSSSAPSCSVPRPWRASVTEAQSGHEPGTRSECPQWWHDTRAAARWSTSVTSQRGHSHTRPQSRHVRKFDQPLRLSSTIAFSSLVRTSSSACSVRSCSAPCTPAMPTTSTGGSGRPSTRSGSSSRR